MKRKIFCFVIVVTVVLVMLCSCGAVASCKDQGNESEHKNKSEETSKKIQTSVQMTGVFDPSITEPEYITFNILSWKQDINEYDIDSYEASSDNVDKALYQRNRYIEKELEVELNFIEMNGSSEYAQEFIDSVHTSIASNTAKYDAIAAHTHCAGALARNGDYCDLNSIETINLDRGYWAQKYIDKISVDDKLYFATGNIAKSLFYQMEFLVINREYADELGVNIEELQELIIETDGDNGGWTLDKMFEITANLWEDTDESGKISTGDRFGLNITSKDLVDLFYIGAGLSYIAPQEEGIDISMDFISYASNNILTKFSEKRKNDNSYFINNKGVFDIKDGKSLMYAVKGEALAGELQDALFTYRILQAPKFDESQKDYYTSVNNAHSLYGIPSDAKNTRKSGLVLDEMAANDLLINAVLYDQFICDKLDKAVLRYEKNIIYIVYENVTIDLANIFYEDLGGDSSPVNAWRNLIVNKSNKVTPYFNINRDRWQGVLDKIYQDLS